jgi:hypothetical protein
MTTTATKPTAASPGDPIRLSPAMHDCQIAARLAAAVDDRLDWQEDEATGTPGDWFPADREDHFVWCDVSDWWSESSHEGPPARMEECIAIDHSGFDVECRVIACLRYLDTKDDRGHVLSRALYTVRVQHVND